MVSRSQDDLIESVVEVISDYRQGEIDPPTPEHVERWINQFDKAVRAPILAELGHVLRQTYVPRATAERRLTSIIESTKLTGKDRCSFWKSANFMDIQLGGNSQHEMLDIFSPRLAGSCGFGVDDCGSTSGVYIYLDDISFSGYRVLNDLQEWMRTDAPPSAEVHIVVLAYHTYGQYQANDKLIKAASAAGKKIKFHWWTFREVEDQKRHMYASEVLRPTEIPNDPLARAYVSGIKSAGYDVILRKPGGPSNVFSSEAGRHLLEQEFLRKGLEIRKLCPNLPKTHHPLGYSRLQTLGFGALHVTFRNCANNCPLVFWVDAPWYPLFPRKNN